MRYPISILAALVLIGLLASSLQAESVWQLNPYFQVQQQYTDNLFLTEDDRESDWITLITPGMELVSEARMQKLSLQYRPSYSLYQDFDEYDTLRHNADLEFWRELGKQLEFNLVNSFERTEQPYDPARGVQPPDDDPSLRDVPPEEQDFTLRRGREPRYSNTARTRLDYAFGPRDNLYAQYVLQHRWDDNPGEEDSIRSSPSLGLEYWLSRLYGLQSEAEYTRGKFEESDDLHIWQGRLRLMRNFSKFLDGYLQYRQSYVEYDGEKKDYQVYEPSAGFSYRFAEKGSMSLGLGYYLRDEEDQAEDDTGLLVNADINKTWESRRSSLRLQGSSGYTETYFTAENLGFTIYYQAGAYYLYALRKDLDWKLNGVYRHNDYQEQDPERRDDILSMGTGLSYMLTRWISLDMDYEFRMRESNVENNEYHENRAMLSLTWQPQGWRLN